MRPRKSRGDARAEIREGRGPDIDPEPLNGLNTGATVFCLPCTRMGLAAEPRKLEGQE